MATKTKPTPAAVRQALDLMRRLAAPTPRERAERRFMDAKAAFTFAAEAAMRGDVDAPELTETAVLEVDAAHEALRAIDQQMERKR